MLYKMVLTFESMDETLKCGHQLKATEQYFPVALFVFNNLQNESGTHSFFNFDFDQSVSELIYSVSLQSGQCR